MPILSYFLTSLLFISIKKYLIDEKKANYIFYLYLKAFLDIFYLYLKAFLDIYQYATYIRNIFTIKRRNVNPIITWL